MCLCTSVFASTHAHVFACEGQGSSLGFFLSHSIPHFLRLGLSMKLGLSSFGSLTDQKDLEIPLSQLPSGLELQTLTAAPGFYTSTRYLNSGSHACVATTLQRSHVPKPQSLVGFLFVCFVGFVFFFSCFWAHSETALGIPDTLPYNQT